MSDNESNRRAWALGAETAFRNLREETIQQESDVLRLPVELYTSPARAAQEIALFKTVPVVVGHHSELSPGGFLTRDVLGVSIILVRREDGTPAGYINMCAHRGGKVEQAESGSKRLFMCQYHGWTYNRDSGDLRNVPFGEDFGEIDRTCYGLRKVRVEERHGLLWADLSNNRDLTVSGFLGDEIDAQVSTLDLADTTLFAHKHLRLAANWKLVVDGALDGLHVKFLHPNGVSNYFPTGRNVYLKFGRHGRTFAPRKRMERLVKEGGALEDITDLRRYMSSNIRVYPNVSCIQAPDHIEFWTVWPSTDPSACTIDIRFLVPTDRLDDECAERVNRSWEVLEQAALKEDFPMEISIQDNANANSGAYFTYGKNEFQVRHLHDCLASDLADPKSLDG